MGKVIVGLDAALAKKKITLTELFDQVGISLSNLSILKTNRAKTIRFSAPSEIYRVLPCDTGDLLRHEEDEDDKTNL